METDSVRQKAGPTPTQLKNLRMLRVAVCHLDDADGQQMTQQLRRAGCHVQAFWPPLPLLPELTDVVFLAVRPDSIDMNFEWFNADAVWVMGAAPAARGRRLWWWPRASRCEFACHATRAGPG